MSLDDAPFFNTSRGPAAKSAQEVRRMRAQDGHYIPHYGARDCPFALELCRHEMLCSALDLGWRGILTMIIPLES